MEGGLTELFLGVTAGAFSPLAVIAVWERFRRTSMGNAARSGTESVPVA